MGVIFCLGTQNLVRTDVKLSWCLKSVRSAIVLIGIDNEVGLLWWAISAKLLLLTLLLENECIERGTRWKVYQIPALPSRLYISGSVTNFCHPSRVPCPDNYHCWWSMTPSTSFCHEESPGQDISQQRAWREVQPVNCSGAQGAQREPMKGFVFNLLKQIFKKKKYWL